MTTSVSTEVCVAATAMVVIVVGATVERGLSLPRLDDAPPSTGMTAYGVLLDSILKIPVLFPKDGSESPPCMDEKIIRV